MRGHGVVFATAGASDILGEDGLIIAGLLKAHKSADRSNPAGQIISIHCVNALEIWAVTEADRTLTTFMLPSEYLYRTEVSGSAH